MTDIKIEKWPIDKVTPYAQNAKKHSDAQVETLARLIDKSGWTTAIVVDRDGVVIAGHGRRLAAIKLGLTHVPVICRRDLSKEAADAMRLADNRVASNDYDMGMIEEELRRLNATGFDMSDTAYDIGELNFILADLGDMGDADFVDNVLDAVEEQKSENEAKVAAVDDAAAPVADALGFKRVTVAESRRIRTAMGAIETLTEKKGVEGLIALFDRAGV